MKVQHQLQTWAADRFDSVQYPHITTLGEPEKKTPFFKHKMSWFRRVNLVVIYLSMLFVGLLVLFAAGVIAYCFISAAMGF